MKSHQPVLRLRETHPEFLLNNLVSRVQASLEINNTLSKIVQEFFTSFSWQEPHFKDLLLLDHLHVKIPMNFK